MHSVLFGAALTLGAAWGCGRVLVARMGLRLTRGEAWVYAPALGAGVLSLVLVGMAALGVVSDGALLALGVGAVAAGWKWGRVSCEQEAEEARLGRGWKRLFVGVGAV